MSLFSHYEPCPKCRHQGRDTRGDNLGVYKDDSAHCWSCGYHRAGSIFKKWSSSSAHGASVNEPKSLFPPDFTREVPTSAWTWLMQYGLGYNYWKEVVGFSPKENRLVIQVGGTKHDEEGNLQRNGPMAFSIGRLVGPPSVDGKPNKKWYVWGDSHKHAEVVVGKFDSRVGGHDSAVVLVEDVVSAHKVAHAGFTSMPLFGTQVHPAHLYYLLNEAKPVVLWLDKDQELPVRRRALRLESVLGSAVRVVVTDDDPKSLNVNTIKDVLQ